MKALGTSASTTNLSLNHDATLLSLAEREHARFFAMKRFLLNLLIVAAALAGMAGCAQVKKPAPQARAMAAGVRFNDIGRVSLYVGEPCTTQIMFEFHGARSTAWLAAPMWETKILTGAANKNQRVHVAGKWRRGGQSNCSYVEVTSAEVTR
jgi:hypothetical protein